MEIYTSRRKPRRDTVHREVCGVHDRSKREYINKAKASAKKRSEGGGILGDLREVKRRNKNENVFVRPNGLHENPETAISCRGSGPARKKKEVCQQPGGGGNSTYVPLWQSSRE